MPSPLCLYSFKDRKIHDLNPPKPSICIGAGHGWLVLSDEISGDLTLFNPTTNRTLPLPKLSTFDNVTPVFDSAGRLTVYNLALRAAPITVPMDPRYLSMFLISRALVVDHEDLTVFLVRLSPFSGLGYAKPGDSEWIAVDFSHASEFVDVVCHKNQIFTVMTSGDVCRWEFGGLFPARPKLTLTAWDESNREAYDPEKLSLYLVTSPSGDLLRVSKERIGDDGNVSIKVHKFKYSMCDGELVEVKSLGENALLLGSNTAICVSAVDVPGLKGNHVYFAEGHLSQRHCDVGVYSMEDGSTEPIPLWISVYPRPAWVMLKLLD